MQNHSLNYCNRFHVTTIFQSMVKQIYLIFVDMLILKKILLTLILKNLLRETQQLYK